MSLLVSFLLVACAARLAWAAHCAWRDRVVQVARSAGRTASTHPGAPSALLSGWPAILVDSTASLALLIGAVLLRAH